jgi:hypothetical protein
MESEIRRIWRTRLQKPFETVIGCLIWFTFVDILLFGGWHANWFAASALQRMGNYFWSFMQKSGPAYVVTTALFGFVLMTGSCLFYAYRKNRALSRPRTDTYWLYVTLATLIGVLTFSGSMLFITHRSANNYLYAYPDYKYKAELRTYLVHHRAGTLSI